MPEFREQDIFIVGYPKSGNTWLQNLIAAVIYGIDPDYTPDALVQEIVPDVHYKKHYKRFRTPMFFKSHALPRPDYRRVIYLLRDGRAVMASTLRKYPHLSTGRAAWRWVRAHRKKQRLIAAQPSADTLQFHYEHIRHDPQAALSKICRLIGLDYEPAMLEFWKHRHCFIAGNGGPILQVAHFQNIQLPVMDAQLHQAATANKTAGKIEQDRNFYGQQDAARRLHPCIECCGNDHSGR